MQKLKVTMISDGAYKARENNKPLMCLCSFMERATCGILAMAWEGFSLKMIMPYSLFLYIFSSRTDCSPFEESVVWDLFFLRYHAFPEVESTGLSRGPILPTVNT